MKRTFDIVATVHAVIELDQSVIDAVDDQWRADFYDLHTPEQIAEHIGANLILGAELNCLDGWADHKASDARFIEEPSLDDCDVQELV